ncbi:MAG: hypothetical protein ACRBBW_15500 [Cellvibrionaceae bacterium]
MKFAIPPPFFAKHLARATITAAIILSMAAMAAEESTIGIIAQPPKPLAVNVYTYHDTPPYFSEPLNYDAQPKADNLSFAQQGFYPEFIRLLNNSQNRYRLTLKHQPRKRLQLQLQQNALNGPVIGVNPIWFQDKKRTQYLWSTAFMNDRDVFVLSSGSTLSHQNLEDFIGITFALPRGYYFKGITELARQGDISLIETSSDLQNLKLVQYGRAQVTIISKPTVTYFKRTLFQNYSFRELERPHDRFTRHWMFPLSQKTLFNELSAEIYKTSQSKHWQDYLSSLDAEPVP